MTTQTLKSPNSRAAPMVKDALDHVRAAAQDLHATFTDAIAKREGATKAEVNAFGQKAKSVADSVKSAINSQNEATKKHLTEAVAQLEATQKHIAEGAKASGDVFQKSINQALADARASVENITQAVAAKRSSRAKKQ